MSKIHIINQYIWPDGSPVCIISEQLAVFLTQRGITINMVGGAGEYRPSSRTKPSINLVGLPTRTKPRQNKIQILSEYFSVFLTFRKYVKHYVQPGDTVLITSAPFLNILLRRFVNTESITTIFWLFDYFPASIHSLKLPKFLYDTMRRWWNAELKRYDSVIKISSNLGYFDSNAVVYRQWPMVVIEPNSTVVPEKKALYTGNLGITHDIDSLVKECENLRDQGYEINFYADGPGLDKLPDWLKARSWGIFKNTDELLKALLEHEIHLVTGTPGTEELSFPSKTWNSIASGRRVIGCGFTGAMLEEFNISLVADYKRHLPDLAKYVMELANVKKSKVNSTPNQV